MKEKLVFTQNILSDIINWLKNGYMICIYSHNKYLFYYSMETINLIVDEKIIYINVSKDTSLLNKDEWPHYIKNEGFVEYKSTDKLPTNEDNIYFVKLP